MKLTTNQIVAGAIATIALFAGIWFVSTKVGCENREVALRNRFTAKQDNLKIRFDTAWKNAAQSAQVVGKYADDFKEAYQGLMAGRYRDGEAQLAKIVAEANPTLDSGMYRQLMDTARSERLSTENEQKELRSIKQEHDNLRQQIPGKWFVGNSPELVVHQITSTRTEEVFQTGKDDNVDLFAPKVQGK